MHRKVPGRKGGWLLKTKLLGPMERFGLSENADIPVYIFEVGLTKFGNTALLSYVHACPYVSYLVMYTLEIVMIPNPRFASAIFTCSVILLCRYAYLSTSFGNHGGNKLGFTIFTIPWHTGLLLQSCGTFPICPCPNHSRKPVYPYLYHIWI